MLVIYSSYTINLADYFFRGNKDVESFLLEDLRP